MTDATMQKVQSLIAQLDAALALAVAAAGPDDMIYDCLDRAIAIVEMGRPDWQIVALAADSLLYVADRMLANGDNIGADFNTLQAVRLRILSAH